MPEPVRTCVGCRGTAPKDSLIRFIRTSDGIALDPGGHGPGRGAYLHPACAPEGISRVAAALRTTLATDEAARLRQETERNGQV